MLKRVFYAAGLALVFLAGAHQVFATGPNYDAYVRHGGGTQPWLNVTVAQTFADITTCNSHVSQVLYFDKIYFNMPYSAGYCVPHP